MKHLAAFFTIGLTFVAFLASAEEQILFVSERDGDYEIYRLFLGCRPERLTDNDRWSRAAPQSDQEQFARSLSHLVPQTGEKIAFSRRMGDTSTRIYERDSSGENEVNLVDLPFFNPYPVWSPRRDKIAFVNRPERGDPIFRIYTVDPEGQNLQLIYENQEEEQAPGISSSGDGTQIIFSRDGGRIAVLDALTHEVRIINLPVSGPRDPHWSPNGQDITFSSLLQTAEAFEPRDGIFIIDRDGNPVRTMLTDMPRSTPDGLAWSPDGNKILVGLYGGLHTLDLDSEAIELFIESGSDPNWQNPAPPRSVSPQNKLNTTWGQLKKGEKI